MENTILHILDKDGAPVLATSYEEYYQWRKHEIWIIGKTAVGKVRVSTVFLGVDHSLGLGGPPLWFETMIFGGRKGEFHDYCERYETISDARIGHRRAAAMVRREVKPGWWARLIRWWKEK